MIKRLRAIASAPLLCCGSIAPEAVRTQKSGTLNTRNNILCRLVLYPRFHDRNFLLRLCRIVGLPSHGST